AGGDTNEGGEDEADARPFGKPPGADGRFGAGGVRLPALVGLLARRRRAGGSLPGRLLRRFRITHGAPRLSPYRFVISNSTVTFTMFPATGELNPLSSSRRA